GAIEVRNAGCTRVDAASVSRTGHRWGSVGRSLDDGEDVAKGLDLTRFVERDRAAELALDRKSQREPAERVDRKVRYLHRPLHRLRKFEAREVTCGHQLLNEFAERIEMPVRAVAHGISCIHQVGETSY